VVGIIMSFFEQWYIECAKCHDVSIKYTENFLSYLCEGCGHKIDIKNKKVEIPTKRKKHRQEYKQSIVVKGGIFNGYVI
jgi:Zn finger protein HypA/HybF involved in hydrogenase expression